MTPTMWSVVEAPGLVTLQDTGRPGLAHLGVPRAGALDAPAAALANRLVGNGVADAVLEVTLAGLTLRATQGRWVAVTGAPCEVAVGGVARGPVAWVPDGGLLRLGAATSGARTYLAIAGGWAVDPVLGSRSTDTLAWVGPPRVTTGSLLPVGAPRSAPVAVDVPARDRVGPPVLRVDPGPRLDRFAPGTLERLCATSYVVGVGDRVGLRLEGDPLERVDEREPASEGMVLGSVQVPPDGRPVVLLADHPVTGGYPVVAVVRAEDLASCAQLRPGDAVGFRRA